MNRHKDIKVLSADYISDGNVMQVATVSGGRPWVCTVYFVADEDLNLYWLSLPTRRHSREIATNSKTAVAIAVKLDQPVIGIQAEGDSTEVRDEETIKNVMKLYVEKYGAGKDFYDNFVSGKNQHKLYKFKPEAYEIFDEVNFPDGEKRLFKP